MKSKKFLFFVTILFVFLLSGCKGKKCDQNIIKVESNNESVVLTNTSDHTVYVEYDIALIDKIGDVIFQKTIEADDCLLKGNASKEINIEEVRPYYLKPNKIHSINANILRVYKYNNSLFTVLKIVGGFSLFCILIYISAVTFKLQLGFADDDDDDYDDDTFFP